MNTFKTGKSNDGKSLIGKLVFVKPSVCEFTDIPQLNRAREQWSLEKIEELTISIKQVGILDATIGYPEGNKFKLVSGRQRMTAIQELARQGLTKSENERPLLIPIILCDKPGTEEEIRDILTQSVARNTWRYEDDVQTRAQSFRTLRDLGYTLEQIGSQTGFSHVYVSQVLDVTGIKVLYDSVKAGRIGVKEASAFVSSKFQKTGKDNKPLKKDGQKIYDEDKIKTALTESIKKANEAGRTKVKTSDVAGISGARAITSKERKNQGIPWLKSLADDSENVPLEIRLVLDCFFLKRTVVDTIKIAKRDKLNLDWLSDVDFSSPRDKKAAKRAANKASKAAKKNPMVEAEDDDGEKELDSSEYEDTDE